MANIYGINWYGKLWLRLVLWLCKTNFLPFSTISMCFQCLVCVNMEKAPLIPPGIRILREKYSGPKSHFYRVFCVFICLFCFFSLADAFCQWLDFSSMSCSSFSTLVILSRDAWANFNNFYCMVHLPCIHVHSFSHSLNLLSFFFPSLNNSPQIYEEQRIKRAEFLMLQKVFCSNKYCLVFNNSSVA